jgi:hypothetical protein
MRFRLLPVLASALAGLAFAGAAFAQSHPCAQVVDPDERLGCYDKAFPPAAGAKPAVDAAKRREQALRDFGLSKVQKAERDPVRYAEEYQSQIEGTVTKVSYRATGERVITLDNGQVWMLTEVSDKGWIKVGQRVVLKTALLGTYFLDTGRLNLRARRLQ